MAFDTFNNVDSIVSSSCGSSNPYVQRLGYMFLGEVAYIHHSSRQSPLIVHKDLLCASSPFFKAEFARNRENKDGIVTLDQNEYDIVTVETYLKWLYSNRILSPSGEDEFRYLVKVYLVGERFEDTTFKNAVIDEIIQLCTEKDEYPTNFAKHIWSNTPEKSPLRRLYVDFYAWASDSDFYSMDQNGSDMENAPRDFLRDALCKMSEVRNGYRYPGVHVYPWTVDRCLYHEHKEGHRCERGV